MFCQRGTQRVQSVESRTKDDYLSEVKVAKLGIEGDFLSLLVSASAIFTLPFSYSLFFFSLQRFTEDFDLVCKRLFYILDKDNDDLLNEREAAIFSVRVLGVCPRLSLLSFFLFQNMGMRVEDAWPEFLQLVQKFPQGVRDGCVTYDGFRALLRDMLIKQGGRYYLQVWKLLRRIDYNENLQVVINAEELKLSQRKRKKRGK